MKELGIYIHIPFCKRKCYYCDFISFPNAENFIEKYIEKLNLEIIEELKKVKEYKIKTIYIGGGTPSICKTNEMEKLRIKEFIDKDTEFTIEVNPGSVTEEKLKIYKSMGINRLSIGMQSTNNETLETIGRIHTYEEFLETFKLARNLGFKNINVDLMVGLPNQTLEDVEKDIKKIINLNPEHISVYSLILEEKTKLDDLVQNGILKLPNEDIERKMYWKVKNLLSENGYNHYEISNFAKEGFESKHNMDCWSQKEYIGFGVASHSYLNNKRYCNTENLKRYLLEDNFEKQRTIMEVQSKKDQMNEYMLLGLRKTEGIKISEFKNKFIDNPVYIYKDILNKLIEKELLEIDNDNIKLTNKGIDFANIVWEKFI